MSAQATYFGTRARPLLRSLATTAASAPLALTFAVLGGCGLGFFAWYATAMRATGGYAAFGSSGLALAVVAGTLVSIAGWYAYAGYFASRAGIDRRTALVWDAPSWLAFLVPILGLVAPARFGSPSLGLAVGVSLFAFAKLLVAARFVHTVRDVLTTFVVTRASIIVVAELASIVIAERPGLHVSESTNPLLAVWGRWDAVHYLDIAERGYYGTDMAFFPLYPTLIRIVGATLGSDLIAGLLISNVALFFGLLFFYKLVEHQYNRSVAHRAIFYVSIFPTAIFFSAVYTESLFFALTVASFYYIRERKWLTAGIVGCFASLTRVEGVLLVVPFLIEVLASGNVGNRFRAFATLSRASRVIAGVAAIGLGLAAYMTYLWVLVGDPLYFSHVQSHWNRRLSPPWTSLKHAYDVFAIGIRHNEPSIIANQAIEVVFTLLMIGILIAGFRRLRPSYAAYMALSILVPMSTSSLMSMPRFALVLFPMFAILALWGGKAWINNTIVAFSLPLLGLFTVLFADWYWVA